MKELRRNIKWILILFIAGFVCVGAYFAYSVNFYGGRWFTNPYNKRLSDAEKTVWAGDILDRNGLILATTNNGNRVYYNGNDTRLSTSHVVGDQQGMTSVGAETFYASHLLGFQSDLADRLYQALLGRQRKGSDVALTVDAALSRAAYSALDGYRGSVALYNYKTGEVLALVSSPGFDPGDIASYVSSKSGPFLNRAQQGQYAPGSIFKIVTAVCALQNGYSTQYTLECGGVMDINGKKISCIGQTAHGSIDMKEAFAKSCNVYFAKLGIELGADKLKRTAEKLGFNEEFLFRDMILYESSYAPDGKSDYSVGWSAVGQDKDIVTPLHMAMLAGSIGNGGVMMEPKMLLAARSEQGSVYYRLKTSAFRRVMGADIANTMKELMRGVVTNGTGARAAVEGVAVCGKTGTAEISDNKDVASNAWFVGFISDEEHPLAIAVIVEGGNSGGGVAAPAAQKVLAKAIALGY